MVTKDSPGDRRIAKAGADVLWALSEAIESGPAEILGRLGHVLNGAAAKPLLVSLFDELKQMSEDGRLRAERLAAPETTTALSELTVDLEREVPDRRRLDLLRRAFLAVAIGDESDPEGTMGLIFMRVARRLTPEEAAVLGSAYRHRADPIPQEQGSARLDTHRAMESWRQHAKRETGIAFDSALFDILKSLVRLKLGYGSELQGADWHPSTGPLTHFGVAFCEFLHRCDRTKEKP